MSSLRRLLPFLRPQMGSLSIAYACMITLSATGVLYVALAGPGLQFMFTGEIASLMRTPAGELRTIWQVLPQGWLATIEGLSPSQSLWFLPTIIVVVAVVKGFTHTAQFFLLGKMSQQVLLKLRQRTFDALLVQSPSFYAARVHGDLLSRLNHDSLLVEQAFFYGLGSILRDTLAALGLLFYLFYSDPKLAVITFVTVPLAVWPIVRFTRWLKRVSKRGQAAMGDMNGVSYEALAGIRVVQAFASEARERKRYAHSTTTYYRQMLVSYFIRAVRTPTMEILGMVAFAILIGVLAQHVREAQADTAHYVSFMGAIFLMYDPLKKLGKVTDYLAAGEAAAERIFEISDAVPEIRDSPNAQHLPPFTDSIRFENVTFAYAPTPEAEDNNTSRPPPVPVPVLDGVTLNLKPGSTTALVGPSGSGKTTIANLLPRFYDVPDSGGVISIDGHDIRDATLASLRGQISVVSQETFLFNTSIGDNIAYGTPHATPESIVAAAHAAYADGFIGELPDAYDTVVGERGVRLSGGQRQRLAIARALLRDAPILILDEATSSLDVESEQYVQRALDALMQGRTCLVIAHRLSTVRKADQIYVLKEGRIIEQGKHEALLAAQGEYSRLHAMQFADMPATEAVSPAENRPS